MSLSNVSRAFKSTLDGTGYPVSVGMRNAATATPCIVYEINGATVDLIMSGPNTLNHWTIEVEVACIADTVDTITDMVDAVLSEWNSGPINNTTYDCKLVLASFSVAFTAETPDDGQQDAERIATVSISMLAQEK
jgi:hypothetical protein